MTLRTTLLASLLLLASASYAGAQETKSDEAAADPQWIEFSAPERGFTASFPVKPTETSTPVEGQNPLLQHQYQAAVGEDTVYTVVVFEYPEGKAPNPPDQEYFANVVTAYAKGSEFPHPQEGAGGDRRTSGLRSERRGRQAQDQPSPQSRSGRRPHFHGRVGRSA